MSAFQCEDGFDAPGPLEPRYTRNDRLDIPDYLYEDEVTNPWDKGDASGLVMWTDAIFWDRMKGSFEARTSDALDVDPEMQDELRHAGPRDLLEALREGFGGKIWKKYGGDTGKSQTFRDVVEKHRGNLRRCGLGWTKAARSSEAQEAGKHRSAVVRQKHSKASFQIRKPKADWIDFVPASSHTPTSPPTHAE